MNSLIYDLRTEADLCRNETADDIAALLDKAADEITRLLNIEFAAKLISQDYQANRFSHDSMITMIEALRHNVQGEGAAPLLAQLPSTAGLGGGGSEKGE